MSKASINPSQPSVPFVPSTRANKDGVFAPILFYYKAGETPRDFKFRVKKGFFSLAEDFDFLKETEFLEAPFEVYDCMAGHFVSIPPSAYWRYPSPIYPFYLVKDGRIQDSDCPDLHYYISVLSDATDDHFDTLPHIRTSSPLPPSSPPGPPPSPAIEYAEKEIQAANIQTIPKKRKAPEVAKPTAKVRKVEVNLHIHCDKTGHSIKRGTGSSEDPIIV